VRSAIKATALFGTLIGQVMFGYLGDRFGRRPMFGVSLAMMIFGALAQGLSFGSSADGVIATLCIWRFFLGIGIGGD
jgi:PHS family inorganic phosphate transporter-like MFS transporter